jgi:hypothetical protein
MFSGELDKNQYIEAATNSKNRPNWNKVKELLIGDRPISDLGCD